MPKPTLSKPSSSRGSIQADRHPPTLSIGLPTYNGDRWIEEAIKSILEQSFKDFELIISDNASTDQTEAICRNIASRDSRVRYHRNNTNIGLYRNFDRAFELSSGKYFKWAADSDYCLDGFFEKCVAALDAKEDAVLAFPQAYLLLRNLDGEEISKEYYDDFNLGDESPSLRFRKYLDRERINNIMHGIIRVSALRKTSLIRPMPGSDISMVAELSLLGKFVEIPERLFVRRFDSETSSILMSASTAAERDAPRGPTLKQRIMLHSYRFITALKAPISWSEKLKVCFYLLRRVIALRHQVLRRLARILIPGR